MKLSLVISTLGRTQEIAPLLESLAKQSFTDFEAIIVDQNEDERLQDFIRPADWPYPIEHIRTPMDRGLSRGRNVGWKKARGEFVLFPDDDCWYPDDFLAAGMKLFHETSADIVCGRAADLEGRSINGRFETTAQWINRRNVFTTQIEWVVFFRRKMLELIDGYDVDIGIGARTPFQACEGQDIVLRALQHEARAYYDPALYGHHKNIDEARPDSARIKKARLYACGLGRVLRLHGYSVHSFLNWWVRPVLKMPWNMAQGRFRKTLELANIAIGRAQGYFAPVKTGVSVGK